MRNWITAKKRQRKLVKLNPDKDDWEIRQINWRLEQVRLKSPICFRDKSCVGCGCDVNWEGGLEYGKDACESGCFPDWMDKEIWLKFEKKWI